MFFGFITGLSINIEPTSLLKIKSFLIDKIKFLFAEIKD
ncbi:hypothetical protein Riv7116_1101 [Rivularia sp. PCC 7116]|nr:hypothetical protein Riv7116_1101 [Rivularia sp. PCC 7116]